MEPESTNAGAPESGLIEQLHAALESALTSADQHDETSRRHAIEAQVEADRAARDRQTAELIRKMLAGYEASEASDDPGAATGLAEVSADGTPPADSRDGVFRVLARAGGPMGTAEIVDQAQALGVQARGATIRSTISKMASSGQITKVRHGVYQLAAGTTWAVSHGPDGTTRAGFGRPSANRSVGRIWALAGDGTVAEDGSSGNEPDEAVAEDEPDEDSMFPTGSDCEIAAKEPVREEHTLSHYTTVRPITDLAAQADQEEDYDEEYYEPSDEDYTAVNENWELAAP